MDSVKGRDISGCYTINGFPQALQVWVYIALPELGANYGKPFPNNPSPPILAYKGGKGRICFKEAILSQKPWKWTMSCWKVTGTWVNTKLAVVSPAKKKVVKKNLKEDCPRPWKKAQASEEATAVGRSEVTTTVGGLTKEDIKAMLKDVVDAMSEGFETCLKEINESVNGANAGRKSLPEDKGPEVPADASFSKDKAPETSLSLVLLDKTQSTVLDLEKEDARYCERRDAALALCRAKSDRTRRLAASQQSPYTENNTAKVIIQNKNLCPGYDPFAKLNKKKLKDLVDWCKMCP
ncbi:uncharacterized protein LOC125582421 [Brassica napus]|uniref:uncharacterized protein LOC125582421 n=1 Tax=Brassica napus TaxID=3708 RepID=UPI0020791A2F|nr:uncharacterized protein LOC125582421 [Brassica napus]